MSDAEALIRKHAAEARGLLIIRLAEKWDDLVELAVERSGPGSIGEAEYGDASFHKSPDDLRIELDQEFADAIFYNSLIIEKQME